MPAGSGRIKKGVIMLKKILVTLAVLALVATPVYSAYAQSNGVVEINPAHQQADVVINAGQKVVFNSGWGACTPGLVVMFENAATLHMSDNGLPFDVANWSWSPIEVNLISPDILGYCIAGDKIHAWSSTWYSPELTFETGTHVIHFYYVLSHQLVDGGDYNGDGKIDKIDGVTGENTFTIIVEGTE